METEKYFRFRPCKCCSPNVVCDTYSKFEFDIVDGLICKTKIPISTLKDYKNGKIYGIDYSSCIAVRSLLFNDSEDADLSLLEFCCAPGVKLLYMMDLLPKCIVTGVDIRKDRLGVAKMLLRKYKRLDRCQLIAADATSYSAFVPCRFECGGEKYSKKLFHNPRHINRTSLSKFDRILVDVECTLDGKEHHVPKGQSKSNYQDSALFRLQKRILFNAFNHLSQEGLLVYSTCSLKVHENECVVYSLLSSSIAISEVRPQFWDGLPLDISEKYCSICDKSYLIGMRMDKFHLETSGMFVAVLRISFSL
eukprot:NODE_379_length_9676_cov_0.362222.p2 type:complete len:307 gc:universal NODE_379_length_9676_cov_0.362222:111-1031(+)